MSSRDASHVRAILGEGRPSVGGWMQISSESVAEIMGAAGFDWVAVDLEHGRIAEAALPMLFQAIDAGGSLPFARVGEVSALAIKAVLDSGGRGVILPMIESAEVLGRAVAWAKYPPRGIRGVGYSRANLFGKYFSSAIAQPDPLVVAQIEHIRGVDRIDEILSVPGLDAVMIGPYDLSASMGITAQFDHPEFTGALARIVQACRAHRIPSGLHVVLPEPDQLQKAVDEGHRFIAYGTDAVFLWKNAVVPAIRIGR